VTTVSPGVRTVNLKKCILVVLILMGLVSVMSYSDSIAGSLNPKRSSSAIAVSSDGTLLLVINPDSNSLSLLSLGMEPELTEIAVGADPRTVAVDDAGERAYVANRGSNSLSVVDLATHRVVADIDVGYRPYGVVVNPDGTRVYVTAQGEDRVLILDSNTLDTIASLEVDDRPSGLTIDDTGETLYITHLYTGAISTIVLDPQPLYLPLLIKYGAGIFSQTYFSSRKPSISVTQYPISTIPLWPDSNLAQSIAIAPDGKRAYIPHTRSNTSNRALTFDTTVFPLVSIIDLATRIHLLGQQLDLGTLDPPGVGLPFDAVVTPDGTELWVLNAASNDISVLDIDMRKLVAHIGVSDNPRGIVFSPDGSTAYVNNTLAGTVSVIDTSAYTVSDVITVTDIPLPPLLLAGKRLFHSSNDTRLARDQWISCNTCHFEGEHDGRTWTFGFSGPRNTTSLLGMIETYPLRWSGEWDESADSEFAIIKENFGGGLIEGDMNCSLSPPDCVHQPPNQARSSDLDALSAFIDSLQMPLSPGHANGESLTETELSGQAIYLNPDLGCVECHPPPLYTDLVSHDVGTATPDEKIGPEYDTPTLRGLYDSAPYFHDGNAVTLYETLTRPSSKSEHDVREQLSEVEIEDLIAFLMALPFNP